MAKKPTAAEAGHIKLSPQMSRLGARDYFRSFLRFEHRKFAPVPFFVCCRAIELALKAMHVDGNGHHDDKLLYSHDLTGCYEGLDKNQQTPSPDETALLTAASDVYVARDFEYLNVVDPATAYARFPDLYALGDLAKKIIDADTS
jgi:hypothetical protein